MCVYGIANVHDNESKITMTLRLYIHKTSSLYTAKMLYIQLLNIFQLNELDVDVWICKYARQYIRDWDGFVQNVAGFNWMRTQFCES